MRLFTQPSTRWHADHQHGVPLLLWAGTRPRTRSARGRARLSGIAGATLSWLHRYRWLAPLVLCAALRPATASTPVVAQAATDFTISHVEYLQVVQRWDNSVPLVQHKPVLLRVYVQASGPNGPLAGGRWPVGDAAMDVWQGTSTAAANYLGNLTPLNSSISVAPAPVDPKTLRYTQAATFNFFIPVTWTDAPNLYLRFGFNLRHSVTESSYTNNNRDLILTLVNTLPLNIVQLFYTSPQHPAGTKPFSDFNAQIQEILASWPIPGVNLYHLATDSVNFSTITDTTRTDDIYFPGANAILSKLETLRMASSSHGGHTWYALQPWDTGCYGTASAVAHGGVGSAESQDNSSACTPGVVMAQEVGHLWGQLHTGHVGPTNFPDPNCCPHGGISKDPTDPVIGFDMRTRTLIAPGTPSDTQAHVHDWQGYGTAPRWVSDYTYERLLTNLRVTSLLTPSDSVVTGPERARYSTVAAQQAPTLPDDQRYLFVSGQLDGDTATLAPAYVMDRIGDADATPSEGPYVIEEQDGAGVVLHARTFAIEETTHPGDEPEPARFMHVLPWDANTQLVVLRRDDTVLATRRASASPPVVHVLTPAANVQWSGTQSITWEAADPDGDPLTYMVEFSADAGQTWLALAEGLTEPRLDVDAGLLAGSSESLVRVVASDGLNTTMAVSAVFSVAQHPPLLSFPEDMMAAMENGQVMMSGDGFDPDDGPLPDTNLVWSMDGTTVLGTGRLLLTPPLPAGHHTFTLTVTDLDGNVVAASHDLDVLSSN